MVFLNLIQSRLVEGISKLRSQLFRIECIWQLIVQWGLKLQFNLDNFIGFGGFGPGGFSGTY